MGRMAFYSVPFTANATFDLNPDSPFTIDRNICPNSTYLSQQNWYMLLVWHSPTGYMTWIDFGLRDYLNMSWAHLNKYLHVNIENLFFSIVILVSSSLMFGRVKLLNTNDSFCIVPVISKYSYLPWYLYKNRNIIGFKSKWVPCDHYTTDGNLVPKFLDCALRRPHRRIVKELKFISDISMIFMALSRIVDDLWIREGHRSKEATSSAEYSPCRLALRCNSVWHPYSWHVQIARCS
jgi:hypothetical protein